MKPLNVVKTHIAKVTVELEYDDEKNPPSLVDVLDYGHVVETNLEDPERELDNDCA